MTQFSGVVFGEGDSLSSEKVAKMVADDVILKDWADHVPLGLISKQDPSGVSVWGGGQVTVATHNIWLPTGDRILQWRTGTFNIVWNTVTTNRIKLYYFVDGTQVYEQWSNSISTTGGLMHSGLPTKFMMNALAAGNHTLLLKADLTAVSIGTNMSFSSHIYDYGKNVAPVA